MSKELEDKIDQLTNEVRFLNKLLTGRGTPSSGLVMRVDRLEQKIKGIYAFAAAGVTIAGSYLGLKGH